MPWAAAVGAAGAVGGGLIGASGSKSAAATQAAAAQQAAQLQYSMYQQTAARLQPWVTTGTAAQQQLGGLLGLSGYQASGAGGMGTGSLVQPFQPTMAQLSQTPGYQFTLQQGLAGVRNAATAQGVGAGITPGGGTAPSGPEGQGLAQYSENLASTTYQQQFQNYWNQLNNIYNMYQGMSTSGANAAAQTGQAGTTAAASAGNALQAAGAASAAGTVGAANALGGGLANAASTYSIISALQNQGSSTALTGGSYGSSGYYPSLGSNVAPNPVVNQ